MHNHHPVLSCFLVTFLSISNVSALDSTSTKDLGAPSSVGPNWKPYKLRLIRRKSIDSGDSSPEQGQAWTKDKTTTSPSSLDTVDRKPKPHDQISLSKQSNALNATHSNQTSAVTILPSHDQSHTVPDPVTSDQLDNRRFLFDDSNHSASKPAATRHKFKRDVDPLVPLKAIVPMDHSRRSLGKSVPLEMRAPYSRKNVFEPRQDSEGFGSPVGGPQFVDGGFEDFDGLFGDIGAGAMMNQVQEDEANPGDPASFGLGRRNMNSKDLSSRHNGQIHGDQSPMSSSSGDTADSVNQGAVRQQQAIKGARNPTAQGAATIGQAERDPTDSWDEIDNEINRINAQPSLSNGQQLSSSGDSSADISPYPTVSQPQPAVSTASSSGAGQNPRTHRKGQHSKKIGGSPNDDPMAFWNPNNLQKSPTESSIPTASTTPPSSISPNSNDHQRGFNTPPLDANPVRPGGNSINMSESSPPS